MCGLGKQFDKREFEETMAQGCLYCVSVTTPLFYIIALFLLQGSAKGVPENTDKYVLCSVST